MERYIDIITPSYVMIRGNIICTEEAFKKVTLETKQDNEKLQKQVEWHQKYNKEASEQLIKYDEKEIKIIKYCKENIEKLETKLHDEIITQSDSERSFYRGMLSAYLDTLRQIKKKEKEGVGIK